MLTSVTVFFIQTHTELLGQKSLLKLQINILPVVFVFSLQQNMQVLNAESLRAHNGNIQ